MSCSHAPSLQWPTHSQHPQLPVLLDGPWSAASTGVGLSQAPAFAAAGLAGTIQAMYNTLAGLPAGHSSCTCRSAALTPCCCCHTNANQFVTRGLGDDGWPLTGAACSCNCLTAFLRLIITSEVFILPAWPPSANFAYTTGAHLSRLHVTPSSGQAKLTNSKQKLLLCCNSNTHLDTALLR
jgi:hypothetical protein